MAAKPYIAAIEEHYHDPQVTAVIQLEGRKNPELAKRLDDLGELRLKEMDEAGVDYQILSLGAPATQRLPADSALQTARSVNDRLAEAVRAHPKRFGAFAALPTTTDAKLAADELERCVTKLGFVGAMTRAYCRLFKYDLELAAQLLFELAEGPRGEFVISPEQRKKTVNAIYYSLGATWHLSREEIGVVRREIAASNR
ncbi:MAG: amidohydrolase family protein [Alphaproteobacteria bacterium]|nr:amidohydrolase family protein [Alphaproteobacteria bacterium]